ncbi:Apolipoprotein N-acyltransferase [Bartonella sp. A1379B]|nr:Apolipoprotein N-acyltransferase [Bartonella sp. A1379B]AQX24318.1 apolipoprotein N-acyltransferase [Bartonella sp. 114]
MLKNLNLLLLSITGWKQQICVFLCGALTSFALPPFYLTPICFLTFPIFIIFLDKINTIHNNKKRLLTNALAFGNFGFGYFFCSLWWLSNALLIDPISFAWALPFSIFCLPVYLSFYWFFAGIIVSLLWTKNIARFFVLAFSLGLAEWLRAILLTGFPWNALGYTAMPTPMFMQSDMIVGLYGMNILAILCYSLPTVLLTNEKKNSALLLCFLLILAHSGFGFYRLKTAPNIAEYRNNNHWVRIVQPSIQQATKMNNTKRNDIFAAHLNLSIKTAISQNPEPDFIIWPEASLPYILSNTPSILTKHIGSFLKPQQWAIIGAIRTGDASPPYTQIQYFNTIAVIDAKGDILHISDKLHLVPFGEYLPYQNLLKKVGLHVLADTIDGYTAANVRRTVMMPNGFSYLPLICYEAIFPNITAFKGPPLKQLLI